MSATSDPRPKPLTTFVFDEVTVLTLKAEPNPQAQIKPPLSKDTPLLTVEADETTELVVKAVRAGEVAPRIGTEQP